MLADSCTSPLLQQVALHLQARKRAGLSKGMYCEDGWVSYISSSSEDLGEDHPGEAVSAIVQCGYNKLKHSVLVLQGAQIEQAAERRWVKPKGTSQPGSMLAWALTTEIDHISPAF